MNRRLIYWTALIGLLTAPLLAQAPRFYLSTERMFAPGQETTVTVETMALTYLDLRIYRIPDPTAFFATRSDLHQPRVRNVYGGPNALAILARAAEMDVIGWQALVRQFLSFDSRKNLLEGVPAWRNPPAVPPQGRGHAEIPLLPGYTLVSQFRHYLAARGENWLYETIPLGLKEPGVYLVEGVCEGDAATTLAVVSELALVTKQSGNRLLSWVVQREGGQPVSGAQITLFSGPGEKKLITAVTDASGLADLPLTGVPTPIVVVQKGPHAVILDPSFYPAQLDHRKVYLTTDRPVYRPGQEVFFKGVARDFIAETYRVVSGKTAAVDLVDPRGHNVASVSAKIGAMGTFSGSFALDDTPPLGTYKVVARLEGKSYQAEFRIREYQKPKFQVSVNLQGSPLNGEQVNAEVRARYYFGAPVTQGDVEYLVYRTRFYLPWWVEEDYNWYYSEAEYQNTRQELIAQGKGKLDPRGNLLFSFAVPPGSDDYTIRVEARVRDAGQFTVSGESSLQTSKGRFVITLKGDRLIAGKKDPVTVDIRTTDLARNPKSQVLTFTVVRPAGDRSGEKVLLTRAVQTDAQGRGQVRFAPSEMGLLHLVARGVDDLGKVITATTSLWVAAPGEKITYAGEGLTIIPNQRSYQVGDRARMLVLSKVPDQAFLFAVEGGDVYHYRVHRLTGNACLVDLPIETRHTPNVFVTASTVFAGQFYEARRNLIVPPRGQFLKVTLKPERPVYRPGDEVAVAVTSRDASGKPVPIEFSLGVVDEAIYAISPELAVEMPRFFYPSKRNNVRTFHSLAFNFYGYSESLKPQEGNRENREDSGLDSIKSARSERVRKDFKDTCFWTPAAVTDASGNATLKFRLPDNITQWRLTLLGINENTQIGTATSRLVSRKELFVEVQPPPTVTARDEIELPVLVQNMTSRPRAGKVSLTLTGGKVIGQDSLALDVAAGTTAATRFRLRIEGPRELELTASFQSPAGGDSEHWVLPITPYGVERGIFQCDRLRPEETGKTLTIALPAEAIQKFIAGRVTVAPLLTQVLLGSLTELAQYPWGCVEQTTSMLIPNLVVAEVLKKNRIASPLLDAKVARHAGAGIAKLLGFQNQNGTWGWWNGTEADPTMTVYVMYSLTLARRAGFTVPAEAYNKGLAAQKALLGREPSADLRALNLYTLAMAGKAPASVVSGLVKASPALSPYALSLLALTLKETGQRADMQKTVQLLAGKAIQASGEAHWEGNVQYHLFPYAQPVDSTAMALRALALIDGKHPLITPAVRWLLAHRTGEIWNSTRDSAAAIMALSEVLRGSSAGSGRAAGVKIRLNGRGWREIPAEKLYGSDQQNFLTLSPGELVAGSNRLDLEKETDQELFVTLALAYTTEAAEVATTGPLTLSREYLRVGQQNGKFTATPLPAGATPTFVPGEEFLVRLTGKAAQNHEYLVLEDFIPAGFQVIEVTRGYPFADGQIRKNLDPRAVTFREARDDRMAFFIGALKAGNQITVDYLLRATRPGRYQVNPARIQSMYLPWQKSLSSRQQVVVSTEERP